MSTRIVRPPLMHMRHIRTVRYHGVWEFIKQNVVMTVAFAVAAITCFIVPPDAKYLEYFDLKTLTCLFCVLAVVCALKNIRFFYTLAKKDRAGVR